MKWEYKVVDFSVGDAEYREKILNEAGAEGFELVSAGRRWAYLKRAVSSIDIEFDSHKWDATVSWE